MQRKFILRKILKSQIVSEPIGLTIFYILCRDIGWQGDRQLHTLMEIVATLLALIVGLISQIVFMSFSGTLFGFEFDVAHSLKKVGYVFVLIGLFISMFQLFKEAEDSRTSLQELNDNLILEMEKTVLATKAKDNFLASMSHEIRTPMNGVLGMTQILADSDLSNEQRDYVDTIQSSGNVLLDIINDILDFSKIEAGKLDLEPIPFDLHHAVQEVGQMFAPKCLEKEVELIIYYDPELPKHFIGDPGRIRQILMNLIGNAVKFTENGHINLAVEAIIKTEEDVHLSFQVTDTGIGISEDAVENVFDSFTQADATTTRKYGGTGLGLTICKQIVELMGGKISVSSQLGKGTIFKFDIELPLSHEEITKIPVDINLSGLRILMVDDNQINLNIISKQLENWSIRGDTVLSGTEAIEKLVRAVADKDPYQLVLTDFNMPEMSGEQLAEKVMADPLLNKTQLLLSSAASMRSDSDNFFKAGFSGYIKQTNPHDYFI